MSKTLLYTFAEGQLGRCMLVVDEYSNNLVYVNSGNDNQLIQVVKNLIKRQSQNSKISYVLREDLDNELVELSVIIANLLDGKRTAPIKYEYLYGTDFQRKVWDELYKIPWGCTTTYHRLARQIGSPNSYRAVANACGANPLLMVIPCHRVLSSNGTLGGFKGGVQMKRQLLAAEKCFKSSERSNAVRFSPLGNGSEYPNIC
ncbi:methylated-DNA--[protein]-cysteine S-methyltransferase LALA0_S19e00298g [Lachancea lanzarotensis]|uniref:Methylated-DNA--protein-cysteine methyltransferase n=1 Tax=Lachancea lanzarotensis TaxID=1245769 RepID=A0A0C7NBC0_9SACH|nr:uncharacterized protein LALA0_S19e00298g [Lachancea lanzarotensis]CEP65055.1 LALA0S19e00298g1_1 [Lachancea lanzarotensis]